MRFKDCIEVSAKLQRQQENTQQIRGKKAERKKLMLKTSYSQSASQPAIAFVCYKINVIFQIQ